MNPVGHQVIAKQWQDWIKFPSEVTGIKKYIPDTTKPKAVIVDIDGTSAYMNGKRGAFEWANVYLDDPDIVLRTILNSLPWDIIFVSGRDSCCYDLTHSWLKKHRFNFNELFMRPEGDTRDDRIIKEEIFWNNIAAHYNVVGVFDDRPKIVRLYRNLGLKVFAVGNQDIDF